MSSNKRATGSGSVRVEVRGLVKRFTRAGEGVVTPVDHMDLSISAEELVVLLGPSGCGKTTLLRCIAGLERPDEGEIVIDGELVFSSARGLFVPPERRQISMIFQSFALWPHMSVFANVAYPLKARGVGRAQIRDRVMAVLAMVGVGDLAEQHPGRMSGGQQQRVALARALVAGSSVVLFDEPLSNVDAQIRVQLRSELRRMQREIGFSALYVTHDQAEAMELGHRVAVLDKGRIAALGAPRDVYYRPPSEYVATFVGAANVLAGRVTATEGGSVRVGTPIGTLSALSGGPRSDGEAVVVVVRPEALRLSVERPGNGAQCLQLPLAGRLFAGPHTEYVLGAPASQLRVWVADDRELAGAAAGQPLWVTFDPERVWLVPPAGVSPAG